MTPFLRRLLLGVFIGVLPVCGWAQTATISRQAAKPGDLPIDQNAVAYEWHAPSLPKGGLPGGNDATASLRFTVDEKGEVTDTRVTDSPDPSLNDLAVAAIKTWKFRPALEQGKPYPMSMDGGIVFSKKKGLYAKEAPPIEPAAAPRTEAEPKDEPPGDTPDVLAERKIPGKVIFSSEIGVDGRVAHTTVLAASHRDFILPALEALKKWEFEPASQGDLKVPSTIKAAMSFTEGSANSEDRQAILAGNAITGSDGQPPAFPPLVEYLADPVYPSDLLLKGVSGEAVVEFVVQPNGAVGETQVRSASDLKFGDALRAAVATWNFAPAVKDGEHVAVTLAVRHVFDAVPATATMTPNGDLDVDVVVEARNGTLSQAKGLDKRLTPVYRAPPEYPAALRATGKPRGQAVVRFVISADGCARLAEVVSATDPQFGVSAVEAVGQWIFEPPLRGGKPVSVQVEIPVRFDPPAS